MRRGKRATHLEYGQAKAIVAGDYLFVKAYEISTEYPPIIMKLTAEICSQLAEGEFIQNRHLRNFRTTESEYLEIAERKTALPLSLAARVGALMADGNDEEKMTRYGYNIGIAFQISDDILDIAGDPGSSKKTTALDIRLGSPNMLIIRALSSSPDRRRILSLLEEPEPDLKEIIDLILETDALEYSRKKAAAYSEKAKTAIKGMRKSKYLEALVDLADFIAERDS
jgi:geranylgeranyl pyrophosphate synthase